MTHGHRITLKRGRETLRFVVDDSDGLNGLTIGAEVNLRGDGRLWTVTKIKFCEIILRIPRAPASTDPSPTGEPKL